MRRIVFNYRHPILYFVLIFLILFATVFTTAVITGNFTVEVNGEQVKGGNEALGPVGVLMFLTPLPPTIWLGLLMLNRRIEIEDGRVRQYNLLGRVNLDDSIANARDIQCTGDSESIYEPVSAMFGDKKLKIHLPYKDRIRLAKILRGEEK